MTGFAAAAYVFEEGVPRLRHEVSADELLDIVKEIIGDDRRCFNSAEWISPPGGSLAALQLPECGTVACLAGWIVLLTRGALQIDLLARCTLGFNAGDIACDVLGMEWSEIEDLFAASGPDGKPLGPANARFAIDRLSAFQQRHALRLRRRRVSPQASQWVVEGTM